jgi:hypothetical protein
VARNQREECGLGRAFEQHIAGFKPGKRHLVTGVLTSWGFAGIFGWECVVMGGEADGVSCHRKRWIIRVKRELKMPLRAKDPVFRSEKPGVRSKAEQRSFECCIFALDNQSKADDD